MLFGSVSFWLKANWAVVGIESAWNSEDGVIRKINVIALLASASEHSLHLGSHPHKGHTTHMELLSMLIKEFEFTFLILEFGAVLNSPTTHSALVSPHMEPHWHHWSTRWILSNIKVRDGRRLCHFLDLIIWHNLHHLAHLSPYPTEWVGSWPFQVVHFCPLQWCDSPKFFLLLWSYGSSLTKICWCNYNLDVPYPWCVRT